MNIVKPNVVEIEQKFGSEINLFKHIEKCGRTCYKSEDKITKDSAAKFVNMIIDRGHTAMLEHGTIYFELPSSETSLINFFQNNKYSVVNTLLQTKVSYITTNYRVLIQNREIYNELLCKYITLFNAPSEYHEKRRTFLITCDRGVTHELVRHRVFSFAQESTRYCNYSKDKFGKEITVVKPCFWDEDDDTDKQNIKCSIWKRDMKQAEDAYFELLDTGATAQEARSVLPNSTKADIVMTGTNSQWKDFFELRCASDAHPQMREIADKIQKLF